MATDTNILREFLVSLGFKIENADRFKKTVEDTEKMVGRLGTAFEAMGLAALGALNKVATKYEKLAYASQRLQGTPIKSIQAFTYAMSQSGTTAEEAMSSLEAFGDFLRSNPSGEGTLGAFGIQTRDAKGNLKDMTQLIMQFGKVAKSMPLYEARAYADMFGISNKDLDALMRNPQAYAERYKKQQKMAGFDPDQIAKAQAQWAQRWRDFIGTISVYSDMLISKLAKPFGMIMNFLQSASKNTHGVAIGFIALFAALMPLMAISPIAAALLGIAGAIALLTNDYDNWKKGLNSGIDWGVWKDQINGISQEFQDLVKVVKDLVPAIQISLSPVISQFVKGELQALRDQLHAIVSVLKAIDSLRHGNGSQAMQHLGQAAQSEGKAVLGDQLKTLRGTLGAATGGRSEPVINGALQAAKPFVDQLFKGGEQAAGQAAQFFAKHGITGDKVKGILGGIFAESGLNPNATNPTSGAYGIGQWLGPRKKELFRRYGSHPNLGQQLEFLLWELSGGDHGGRSVLGARNADEALSAYVNNFMRPGPGAGGDLRRGRAWLAHHKGSFQQVNINNKTDIHVHGTGSPEQTADAVARQQQRVYGNTVRWNKPAAS